MSVRIRMKKMGRTHRPFYRICAMDKRAPRDGRPLEELGTYDPSIADVDARAQLKTDRIAYWLSVGAQPSEKCAVLIKKYGEAGTHLEAQKAALEKLAMGKEIPDAGKPAPVPKAPEEEANKAEEEGKAAEETQAPEEGATESGDAPAEQAKADDAPAAEEAPAEEKAEEEKSE